MNDKKKPVRKCIACRKQSQKKEFLRVVRLNTGEVLPDFTGKQNGRGAYICKNADCFEKAKKENSFQRALKCSLGEEELEQILKGILRVTKD